MLCCLLIAADCRLAECKPTPGQTRPVIHVVERRWDALYIIRPSGIFNFPEKSGLCALQAVVGQRSACVCCSSAEEQPSWPWSVVMHWGGQESRARAALSHAPGRSWPVQLSATVIWQASKSMLRKAMGVALFYSWHGAAGVSLTVAESRNALRLLLVPLHVQHLDYLLQHDAVIPTTSQKVFRQLSTRATAGLGADALGGWHCTHPCNPGGQPASRPVTLTRHVQDVTARTRAVRRAADRAHARGQQPHIPVPHCCIVIG